MRSSCCCRCCTNFSRFLLHYDVFGAVTDPLRPPLIQWDLACVSFITVHSFTPVYLTSSEAKTGLMQQCINLFTSPLCQTPSTNNKYQFFPGKVGCALIHTRTERRKAYKIMNYELTELSPSEIICKSFGPIIHEKSDGSQREAEFEPLIR